MKNPTAVAEKWSRNLASSQDSIRAGVQAVTVNPAERAIQRKQAYLDGVQRAVADGRYERGLRKVTLEGWKQATLDKGLTRIAQGAAQAKGKMAAFMEQWLQHEESLKAKLANMPRGDLQTNIQRMVESVMHNASFRLRT